MRRTALGAAGVLVAADLALRIVTVLSSGGDGAVFGTALIAAALGCLAGLLVRRAPAIALLAGGAAAWLAALDLVGIAQAERLAMDAAAWRTWLVLAELGLVAGAGIAAALAGSLADHVAQRWRGAFVWLLVGGALAVAVVGLVTAAQGPVPGVDGHADPTTIRLSGRAALGFAAVALGMAVAVLVHGPLGRARAASRSAAGELPQTERVNRFARALGDELPGRAGRDRVAEEERARLAADIHAQLLPGLRRAARAAEGGDVPASIAHDLRAAVADAETLMDARQSVVLEESGLIAALELLAERTVRRDGLDVTIDLDEAPDPLVLPQLMARAAFRVAILAVDNVSRHAGATRIGIKLRRVATDMALAVADDGVGIDPARRDAGGRGLRDMESEARRIRGTVTVTRGEPPATGTRVELRWPTAVAGNPASTPRALPDGEPPGQA